MIHETTYQILAPRCAAQSPRIGCKGSQPIRLGYVRALGLGCCIALCSCNENGNRRALEGTVTLDGQPLAAGGIEFFPLPGTGGPTAGGQVKDGRFYVASKGGCHAWKVSRCNHRHP